MEFTPDQWPANSALGYRSSGLSRIAWRSRWRAPRRMRGAVHLRVTDSLGDLRLGEVLDEAEPEHQKLPFAERRQPGAERGPLLDGLEPGILDAHPIGERRVVRVRAGAGRLVKRKTVRDEPRPPRTSRAPPAARIPHDPRSRAPTAGGRGRPSAWRSPLDQADPLLEPTRHAQREDAVPEVPPKLAEDGGGGVGGEGNPAAGVNRSIACRSPRFATWSRSSCGSLPRYRRARLRASGMKRSTSSSRAAGSAFRW